MKKDLFWLTVLEASLHDQVALWQHIIAEACGEENAHFIDRKQREKEEETIIP
jgi:hypothetical protein